MKIQKALAGIAALALATGVLFASATAASATYETPPQECVPTEGTPGYWEDVPDITHPAVGTPTIVIENPDYKPATEGTAAVWANFSPNDKKGPFVGPPSYPTDERGTWHLHDKIPGGHEGPDGVYYKGNPHKGGDWFYRQAAVPGTPAEGEPTIEVTNPDYKPEWVEVTPDIWHDPIPPVVCPPDEPEVVVPGAPVVKDKCGVANDHYGLPEGPAGITYSRDGLDVIATPDEDYVLGQLPEGWEDNGEGTARYPFTATEWTDEPCSEEPETPEPTYEIEYGAWTGGEPTCEEQEVTQTRTVTVTETTYGWVWEDDQWKPTAASSTYQDDPETRTVVWEGEDCPTPTPTPTATPTPTVTPTPTITPEPLGAGGDDGLAETGGEPLNPWVPTIGALAVALGLALAFLAPILHRRTVKIEE